METILLNANKRNKKANAIRAEKQIPAVIYGKGKDSVNLSVDEREFEKVFKKAGQSAIIDLSIDSNKKKVLVQDIDFHPVSDKVDHIDFYEVSMTEKITTTVPLKFIGESLAVSDLGGTLITNKSELEVECLPLDLPHEIEIDISPLADFEASIHISDVKVSDKVEIKGEAEETIASVEPPRSEEELAELEEPVEEGEMPEADQGGDEADETDETEGEEASAAEEVEGEDKKEEPTQK